MFYRLFTLSFLCLLSGVLYAQQNTVPSGGDINGVGGSASYSVGQIDYTTKSSATGTITEGLQQPYEIIVVTGSDNPSVQLSMNVYPNPVIDQLILKVDLNNYSDVFYSLMNVKGELISKSRIYNQLTEIQFKELAQGIYFIKVEVEKKEIKVFKIIKN